MIDPPEISRRDPDERDDDTRCPRHGISFAMIARSPTGPRVCPLGDRWHGVIGGDTLVEEVR